MDLDFKSVITEEIEERYNKLSKEQLRRFASKFNSEMKSFIKEVEKGKLMEETMDDRVAEITRRALEYAEGIDNWRNGLDLL